LSGNWSFLGLPFAQHALIAATLVSLISGMVGPFVIARGMSFAVHGAAELALTGAAAGLLVADNAVAGALLGSLVVATAFGLLAVRERERDSAIGVVLALGLGLGFFLLHYYHGFASEALNILVGQITAVSTRQIQLLSVVAVGVLVAMAALCRPLTFASVDPEVAQARGVRTRLVGVLFLFLLCITVTEAAQIVGTILVLSLAITPAAAASRLSARTPVVIAVSIAFALIAADGGLLLSLIHSDVKASVFISAISFALYVLARLAARWLRPALDARRRLAAAGPQDADVRLAVQREREDP
jgi:zinc/manganese transport system permease protein